MPASNAWHFLQNHMSKLKLRFRNAFGCYVEMLAIPGLMVLNEQMVRKGKRKKRTKKQQNPNN